MARRSIARNVDLVFQGGGVKGIALVGALSVLEEKGFRVQNRAGTSAGAIVATLHAAGFSAGELEKALEATPLSSFRDKGWEDRIPVAGVPLSILMDQGIYEGKEFLEWFGDMLAEKNVRTFGDLVHPDFADHPKYRHKVQVVVSDLTDHRMLALPRDADELGVAPDEFDVATAVRASMSIPLFFEPLRFRNPKTGREHVLVDGGLLSNFPVWIFDSDGVPEWPTFGLMLVEQNMQEPLTGRMPGIAPVRGPLAETIGFVKDLAQTAIEAHDRTYLDTATYVRTITIPNCGVPATKFDLDAGDKTCLWDSGRNAAMGFLKTWSFKAYVKAFRSGSLPPTRREMIAAAMRRRPKPEAG